MSDKSRNHEGVRNPNARLNEMDIAHIIDVVSEVNDRGEPLRKTMLALANELGVSLESIRLIWKGKRWRG